MAPAKTADEWISRLQRDLQNQGYSNDNFSRLYAELPAQDQWISITNKLDTVTKDEATYAEFTKRDPKYNNHYFYRSEGSPRLQLKLLSTLLKEDGTDAEPIFRELIKTSKSIPSYRYDKTLNRLLLVSKNKEKTVKWYKDNIKKTASDITSSRAIKSAWKQALAKNKIDKGIKLLQEAIDQEEDHKKISLITNLAKIARLLNKPELAERALTMLENALIKQKESGKTTSLNVYYVDLEHYFHTEQYQRLIDFNAKLNATQAKTDSQHNHNVYSSLSSFPKYKAAALYKLGKFKEFEALIDELVSKNQDYPTRYFNALDTSVADLPTIGSFYLDLLASKPDSASKQKAYKICAQLLARNRGKDAYYKRAIKLDREAATTLISSLREYDPYEERPLIWQAEIALEDGDINKAEELISAAIALDPSDGDHGKFTRMHCYDVLARICAKQGNTEKETFLNEVVISIRQGEAADDYLYAGLITEATTRYKKALGHFNDAYCLQSRLAKTLMEAGKFDEAIPHFKKAFELMPVSFGPRESHCFGCEGLFDDERVQNLALPTLKAFLETEPANPRTPYLLGLLFEEMKKEPEAISAYKKALELDPNYYNAGKNLKKLLAKDFGKFKEVQALNMQLFKIAAYPNKANYMPSPHLLKSYWNTAQSFPPSPLNLPPLSELGFTKAELSEIQYKEIPISEHNYLSYYYSDDDAIDGWSKQELLNKNRFIKDTFN